MEDSRQGSIHDIDAAPDAPDSSSLMSDVGSEIKSPANNNPSQAIRRNTPLDILSPSFLRSNISTPSLNEPSASVTPRKRHEQDKADQSSGDGSGSTPSSHLIAQRKISEDSFAEFLEDDDNADDTAFNTSIIEDAERKPRVMWFCGCIPFPLFWNFRPKWTRYAAVLVRNAPCFWFCFRRLEVGATDRSVVYRLNLLCASFALIEIAFSGYAMVMLYWPSIDRTSTQEEETSLVFFDLWSINSFAFIAGALACVVLIVEIATLPLIRKVNLIGAIWYYEALGWFLPLQAIVAFGLFDFFHSTDVWIKHWWGTPSMALYRQLFCLEGTYNTRCVVPIGGEGSDDTEESWCIKKYNKTDCTMIRENAQEGMGMYANVFFSLFGVVCLLLILLLWLTRFVLSGIISKAIIERHRESHIATWLAFPIILSFSLAMILFLSPTFHPDNLRNVEYKVSLIAICDLVCGAVFIISALLALYAGTHTIHSASDKRIKTMAAISFLALNMMNVIFIIFILSNSIITFASMIESDVDDNARGNIACLDDDGNSCTCCECTGARKCPEWTSEDVTSVLQSSMKTTIVLAAILLMYAIATLRYGVELKHHISMYEIDYV